MISNTVFNEFTVFFSPQSNFPYLEKIGILILENMLSLLLIRQEVHNNYTY